ncbi:MAG: HD domain-containing protein [Candidatus Aenigmarchaeota archaeon]
MRVMVSRSQFNGIKEFARKRAESLDYNHDFEHIERTAKYAELLAKKEGADKDVCVVAAWLHDTGKAKNEEVHGDIGARMAKPFLERLGFESGFIEKVCHAIECHDSASIHKAKTIEAKVVFDSDKLQAIGPFGFGREFSLYTVFKEKKPREAFEIVKKNEANRFKNELQTDTAKELASKPFELMLEFYKLYKKWDRADID